MSFVRGHFRRTRSGFTYVRPSLRRSSGSGALGIVLLVMIGIVVSVVMAIVQFIVTYWIYVAALLVIGCAIVAGVVSSRKFRQQRVNTYLQSAREAVEALDDRFDEVDRLAKHVPTNDQQRMVGEEEIYRVFVAQILADGRVSHEESAKLQRVNATFAFDPQRALAIREEAFDGFISWVGLDLTEEQETAARAVATGLDIPRQRTESQLAVASARRLERESQIQRAAEYQRRQAVIAAERKRQDAIEAEREQQARLAARREREAAIVTKRRREAEAEAERAQAERARQEQLEAQRAAARGVYESEQRAPVASRVKLKRGESCWLAVPARLQERKVLRAGELFITNDRVLFLSDTVVSVALSKVLDIAADPDSGVLRLVKDGRKSPYEFILEHPLVALAHVERSLTESCAV
jgi:hypothetical protein